MAIPTSQRLTKTGALAALLALFATLAVLPLSYLFCAGFAEAVSLDGRMPGWSHPYEEAFSSPAHFAANLPFLQIPARFGIDFGYSLAHGPDTTR